MYQVKRPPASTPHPIRNPQYHRLRWGPSQSTDPVVVMVHGWMDVAASYQFMVDALSDEFVRTRTLWAPDWRGYGHTPSGGVDNYWFDDYLADLDFFLDQVSPDKAVDLIGHSMGGHVAMMYAAARPHRVRRLVNLEGFGGPDSAPNQTPKKRGRWMDELKSYYAGELALRPYASSQQVAARLMKTNPRLARSQEGVDRAQWLATHWAKENATGQWDILGDAAHKIMGSEITREDEILASYACLSMPVLAVEASDDSLSKWWEGRYSLAQYHARLDTIAQCKRAVIQDAGHMLHHDQPAALADLIESFLA